MMDLDELERKAMAATPGPYRRDRMGEKSGFERVFAGHDDGPGLTLAQWMLPDDAALYSACSPEIVLALVRVARAGLAWQDGRNRDIIGTAPPGGQRSDTGKVLWDAIETLRGVK